MKNRVLLFSILVFGALLGNAIVFAEEQNIGGSPNYLAKKVISTLEKVLGTNVGKLSINITKTGTRREQLPYNLYWTVPSGIMYFACFSFSSAVIKGSGVFYIFKENAEKDLVITFKRENVDLNKTPRLMKMIKIGEEKSNITKLGKNVTGGPQSFTIRNIEAPTPWEIWYTSLIRVKINYRFTYTYKMCEFLSKNPTNITPTMMTRKVPIVLSAVFGVPKEHPSDFVLMTLEIGPTAHQESYKGAPACTPYDPYVRYVLGPSVSQYLAFCLNFSVKILHKFYWFVEELPSNRTFYGWFEFFPWKVGGQGKEIQFFSPILGKEMKNPDIELMITGNYLLGTAISKGGRLCTDWKLYNYQTGVFPGGDIWSLLMKNGKPQLVDQDIVMDFLLPPHRNLTKTVNETLLKAISDPNMRTNTIGIRDKKLAREVFCNFLLKLGEKYNSKMLKSLARAFLTRNITVYDQKLFKINVSYSKEPSFHAFSMKMSIASSSPSPLYYSVNLTKFLNTKLTWRNKTFLLASYKIEIFFKAENFYEVFPPRTIIKENLTKEEAYALGLRYLNISKSQVFSWSASLRNYYWGNEEYQYYELVINKTINTTYVSPGREKVTVRPYLVLIVGNKVTNIIPLAEKTLMAYTSTSFLQKYWRAILAAIVVIGVTVGMLSLSLRRRHGRS